MYNPCEENFVSIFVIMKCKDSILLVPFKKRIPLLKNWLFSYDLEITK